MDHKPKMPSLTSDQINRLKALGIKTKDSPSTPTAPSATPLPSPVSSLPSPPQSLPSPPAPPPQNLTPPSINLKSYLIIPAIPATFGLLLLVKSALSPSSPSLSPTPASPAANQGPEPTQVPKGIQHYLLASQQFFSQALQAQNSQRPTEEITTLLNQSLENATAAINLFPQDPRGWTQRAELYASLPPQDLPYLNQALAAYQKAYTLQPTPQVTRQLALLWGKKGQAVETIRWLEKTVLLEPTNAQNFYDLARTQTQAGLLTQAVKTYEQLVPLIVDPTKRQEITATKNSLEQLLAQNIQKAPETISPAPPSDGQINLPENPPAIQASLISQGLLIAAPDQEQKELTVTGQTDSNSTSGLVSIPPGQKETKVYTNLLNDQTQVYLATEKGGKNLTPQVASKYTEKICDPQSPQVCGNYFTISLDSPTPDNMTIRWWIIE